MLIALTLSAVLVIFVINCRLARQICGQFLYKWLLK